MDAHDEVLAAMEQHLQRAEAELHEREDQARAGDAPSEVLLALAAECDRIAHERDSIADARDENATTRDLAALNRDVGGSARDRRARVQSQDLDPGAPDRFASGADRDFAAGDRGDSFDDRSRAHEARERAARDRDRSAQARDAAAEAAKQQPSDPAGRSGALGSQVAKRQEPDLAGFQDVLESRVVIGQAQGLLMALHHLSPEAAFQVLVRLSQERDLTLRELAGTLVASQVGAGPEATRAPADDRTDAMGGSPAT